MCAVGEGGTPIFSYIHMAWTIFFGSIFFFFFLGGGGFRKNMNIFGGMNKLWIFLGDHHIIGLFFFYFFFWGGGGIFKHLRAFS